MWSFDSKIHCCLTIDATKLSSFHIYQAKTLKVFLIRICHRTVTSLAAMDEQVSTVRNGVAQLTQVTIFSHVRSSLISLLLCSCFALGAAAPTVPLHETDTVHQTPRPDKFPSITPISQSNVCFPLILGTSIGATSRLSHLSVLCCTAPESMHSRKHRRHRYLPTYPRTMTCAHTTLIQHDTPEPIPTHGAPSTNPLQSLTTTLTAQALASLPRRSQPCRSRKQPITSCPVLHRRGLATTPGTR